LRSLAADVARGVLARVDPPPPPPLPPVVPLEEQLAPPPPPAPVAAEQGRATAILRGRFHPQQVAAVEERIASHPDLKELYERATPLDRARALLSLGIYLLVSEVGEISKLGNAQPPDDVHAMARGPLAAAGGLYEADLVADMLAEAGIEIENKRSALDFGCSSGRVVRVLAAAWPETSWHGCDPNEPAIAWAREALPTARFFRSPDRPPLDLPAGSLDLVYAISIWSHFAPALGLEWFDEMHRVLRPGGHLLVTTHGRATVAHDGAAGLRDPDQLARIDDALRQRGSWYAAEFGETGDWGVVNSDWGTSFLTPEWLLAQLTPRWRLLQLSPGRLHGNQDVYLLERR